MPLIIRKGSIGAGDVSIVIRCGKSFGNLEFLQNQSFLLCIKTNGILTCFKIKAVRSYDIPELIAEIGLFPSGSLNLTRTNLIALVIIGRLAVVGENTLKGDGVSAGERNLSVNVKRTLNLDTAGGLFFLVGIIGKIDVVEAGLLYIHLKFYKSAFIRRKYVLLSAVFNELIVLAVGNRSLRHRNGNGLSRKYGIVPAMTNQICGIGILTSFSFNF